MLKYICVFRNKCVVNPQKWPEYAVGGPEASARFPECVLASAPEAAETVGYRSVIDVSADDCRQSALRNIVKQSPYLTASAGGRFFDFFVSLCKFVRELVISSSDFLYDGYDGDVVGLQMHVVQTEYVVGQFHVRIQRHVCASGKIDVPAFSHGQCAKCHVPDEISVAQAVEMMRAVPVSGEEFRNRRSVPDPELLKGHYLSRSQSARRHPPGSVGEYRLRP